MRVVPTGRPKEKLADERNMLLPIICIRQPGGGRRHAGKKIRRA